MIAKTLATALVGTALISGAAMAQTTTTTPMAPAPGAASTATTTPQSLQGNWRASKLVGLAVYNDANERLGDISEVLIDSTGKVNAVVIGIGGFLGVGQHDIAVGFDKLKWVNEPVRSASADRTTPAAPAPGTMSNQTTGSASNRMATTSSTHDNWYPDHAVMSGTKEQLKAMPAFKYSDNR
ncbi:MAG: PRC-barrel domain-containing protein [Afipia sp.]|nr:PRC-barrel domain-containing protein [Afipia sp.]